MEEEDDNNNNNNDIKYASTGEGLPPNNMTFDRGQGAAGGLVEVGDAAVYNCACSKLKGQSALKLLQSRN